VIPTCFGIGIKGDDTKNDTKFIKKIYKQFKTKYHDRRTSKRSPDDTTEIDRNHLNINT